MTKPVKKKVMVQLWNALIERIDIQFTALHLKRDAYLNTLFAREIEQLANEVMFRNADAVRVRLNERKLPSRIKLTMELDEQLIARIDQVLAEKNIPRDAFVNRVLFFLCATESILKEMKIPYRPRSHTVVSGLGGAYELLSDPLAHIRQANNGQLYTTPLFPDAAAFPKGPNLFGLNVAIPEQAWQAMCVDDAALMVRFSKHSAQENPTQDIATTEASSLAEIFARRVRLS